MSSPATTLVADDDNGTDGTTPGTSDTYGRVSSSGRVIKQTNKGKIFSAALLVAQAKQTNSQSKILGYSHKAHLLRVIFLTLKRRPIKIILPSDNLSGS